MYQLEQEDIAGLPKVFPKRDYREFVAVESLKALSSRTEPLRDEEFKLYARVEVILFGTYVWA